jgi:choline kinase
MTQRPNLAVITAAGLGSRLGYNVPKCLVEVEGKTILEHQLALLDDIAEVRVVVGYENDRVARLATSLRSDVVIVDNMDYAMTTVLQSLKMGVGNYDQPFLSLEGDVVFEPTTFASFLNACDTPGLLGLTPTGTEQAWCVDYKHHSNGSYSIHGFRQQPTTDLEWTGLAYFDPSWIVDQPTFTNEAVSRHLPVRGRIALGCEVDTQADLDRAVHALRTGDWGQIPTNPRRWFGQQDDNSQLINEVLG